MCKEGDIVLIIREAAVSDLDSLKELYCFHLVKTPPPPPDRQAILAVLQRIIDDESYHLLVGESGGLAVSSVTLVVIKNLTHNAKPYAIIENVVTHADFRGKGFAQALMAKAGELAEAAGCYKIMLMTGSKEEGILGFYEKCGYNRNDKTGFIKWL
jgi:GNAT superfamily N-acetyltransferase